MLRHSFIGPCLLSFMRRSGGWMDYLATGIEMDARGLDCNSHNMAVCSRTMCNCTWAWGKKTCEGRQTIVKGREIRSSPVNLR